MKTSIYEQAVKLMNASDIDHHESDLYLKVNEISEKIISKYEFKNNVTRFRSNIDGNQWFDIPFVFDLFWK